MKKEDRSITFTLAKISPCSTGMGRYSKRFKKADESRKEDLVVLINGFWRKFKMPKRILLHEEFEEIQPYSTCCWL